MFDRTKAKLATELNDRVTNPIRTAVVISVAAFIMASIALIIAVHHADN